MRKLLSALVFTFIFLFVYQATSAPTRLAVLPFENMDGSEMKNVVAYQLMDSIYNRLQELDPNQEHYVLVPADSIFEQLAQYNMDPQNPQYKSDMWKAVKDLKIKKVIYGNYTDQSGTYLINAYVYNVKMKLPMRKHEAKDIFKDKEILLEAVEEIIQKLKPLLIKN
jgi:TolB-like protein